LVRKFLLHEDSDGSAAAFLNKFTGSKQRLWLPFGNSTFEWWTENHTFILLTTAAFMCKDSDPTRAQVLASLDDWMSGHMVTEDQGFLFEKNSPPYTMHSVECLLLLHDFPILNDPNLTGNNTSSSTAPTTPTKNQSYAGAILTQVFTEILSVSVINGSWLSAAVRMYPKNRLSKTLSKPDSAPPSIPKLPTALFEYSKLISTPGQTLPLSADHPLPTEDIPVVSSLSSNYLTYGLWTTSFLYDPSQLPEPGVIASLPSSLGPGHQSFTDTNMPFKWYVPLTWSLLCSSGR
jgi:hypothetical protein